MGVALAGGFIRAAQGLLAAAPTLIIGLFVAALFRYYLRAEGTQKLFGGQSLRSLPQSWAVGMLLPVCSIGVIPIIREMRRQGASPGAITAFALAAPLFNPLSLLYGLTLSRPFVIIGFAIGSLVIVTILGLVWDRVARGQKLEMQEEEPILGLPRLAACAMYMTRELFGPTGGYALVAALGLFLLGAVLPHGALQSYVEQLDPLAPARMSLVSLFVYATPILTMSQLGMMFDHGNSPGAAFALLLLGTGIHLGTLLWVYRNFGWRSTSVWCVVLFASVLGIAYAVERPLIPPGVEPAGHTHAFDIYTNPLHSGAALTVSGIFDVLGQKVGLFQWIGGGALGVILLLGFVMHRGAFSRVEEWIENAKETESVGAGIAEAASEPYVATTGLNQHVSPRTVGLTCLAGLVAFSIVGCYAFYPNSSECLEEMRLARTEVLSAVTSKDYERARRWIPILEGWSRKMEVGYAIREFELRPYQQMQTFLLRKKLELLEHAMDHASGFAKTADSDPHAAFHLREELAEMNELRSELMANASRLKSSFQ